MEKPLMVGVIGCGTISSVYLQAPKFFSNVRIAVCADLDMSRAQARAAEFGVPKACSVEELLADPEIDIVLNLTVPAAHAGISLAALLEANKSIYSEKPLAITSEDGQTILQAARAKGLSVGCAPDTFLGNGLQTCIKLINEGAIGAPVAATAFMMSHGMENWHPDPFFFYQPGAGPLFDWGPYYLTALISMLGPIKRVSSSTKISFSERTITSLPKAGTKIPVNTPTHVAGLLEFANGTIVTLVTSFDVWHHRVPCIEIYGTEGTLGVPDPGGFDGPVSLGRAGEDTWEKIPLIQSGAVNSRGLGLADMIGAMQDGRNHRANGDMAYHVLEVMEALQRSSTEGQHLVVKSTCSQPEPFGPGAQRWD